ncbi:MAG: hypothetical protein M3461_15060 [Pseudomonadota bacterium]|nr:hypothetical protein [Pseudomonadota bacterium]
MSFSLPVLMRNAEAAGTPTANTFAPNAFIRIDRQGRVTPVVYAASPISFERSGTTGASGQGSP